MNTFERTAIYTMLETVEAQIRGLKSMIAASSGTEAAKPAKTTSTLGNFDDQSLSDDEEALLERQLRAAREKSVRGLADEAQDVFVETLAHIAGGTSHGANGQ